MIRPDERTVWTAEDYQLDEEFLAESSRLRVVVRNVPPVPADVNARIRRLAHRPQGEAIERHWIFGTGAQLTLGIVLFFAIGLLYLFVLPAFQQGGVEVRRAAPDKTEMSPLETIDTTPPAIVRIAPVDYPRREREMRVAGWVLVEFEIASNGRVHNARILDRCTFRPATPDAVCVDSASGSFDQWVLDHMSDIAARAAMQAQLPLQPPFRVRVEFNLPDSDWE